MNVTNDSFDTIKSQIFSEIESCEFVALDLELTGLHATNMSFIGTEIAYYHHRKSATEFLPIQVGLCIAQHNDDSDIWELKPYNFYIFPSDNRTFVSSTASIKFLGQNDFDFNHWVKQGIPFLGQQEEEKKRQILNQRYNIEKEEDPSLNHSTMPPSSQEDKDYIQSKKTKVRRWMARVGETPDPLRIEEPNPKRRKLLYQSLHKEFSNIHLEKKIEDSKIYILVYNMSSQELKNHKIQKRKKESELIDKAVGFRHIIDKIFEYKKPIVGHNCFFDLLHIYQTFIADLPQHLPEFRQEFQKQFPLVFDTKLVAERNPDTLTQVFGSNLGSLSTMFDSLPHPTRSAPNNEKDNENNIEDKQKEKENEKENEKERINSDNENYINGVYRPRICTAKGFEQYTVNNSKSSHEAGFDAFMTAHIFLNELAAIVGGPIHSNIVQSKAITPMANCVRLIRTTPRSIQLDLGINPDEEYFSATNALHISQIPKVWRYQDIARLFQPDKVNVRWVDESSLWVLVSKRRRKGKEEGSIDIKAVLERVKSKAPDIVIQTHEEYMKQIGYPVSQIPVGTKRKRSDDNNGEVEDLPPTKRSRSSCCIQ